MPKESTQKKSESQIQGTAGARMPDPNRISQGESEERARDAFTGRPLKIQESRGDMADRAYEDSEAELNDQIERIRRKVGKS